MKPLPIHLRASMGATFLLALTCALITAPASANTTGVSADVQAALAPSGRLRACINLGNPVLAHRDASTGTLSGVSVDLAQELGRRLGVPVDLLAVPSAGESVEVVKADKADIGFFAIDPLRGQGVAFSAAYVQIEGGYLVRNDSPLTSIDQVDQVGQRVAVGKGSAYDLYLTRALKNATIVRIPTSPAVVGQFIEQHLDVAAGVKQQLEADATKVSGVRLLPGRFMVIEQAMGIPASRTEVARQALRDYVEDVKASGFVARSLQHHGIEGAQVAPGA